MRSLTYRLLALSFAVTACGAPATTATVTAPTPTTAPNAPALPTGPATRIPAVTMTEPPKNWQLLDEVDRSRARHQRQARDERAAAPARRRSSTVLVAIIDNGIDTLHADLKANLWRIRRKSAATARTTTTTASSTTCTAGTSSAARRQGRELRHVRGHARSTRAVTARRRRADRRRSPTPTQCKQIDADYQKQRTKIEGTSTTTGRCNDVLQQIVPMLAASRVGRRIR